MYLQLYRVCVCVCVCVCVLQALGISSDQEAVQLVGSEPQFADELAASLEEAGSVTWNGNTQRGVFTQAWRHEFAYRVCVSWTVCLCMQICAHAPVWSVLVPATVRMHAHM